jgi:hypothetical protein
VRAAVTLLIAQAISFLLVIKHPGLHYFIPLYLSTGLNLVLLWDFVRDSINSFPARVLATGVLVAVSLCGLRLSFEGTKGTYMALGLLRRQQLDFYARVSKETRNDLRIDYYRSNSPEFAAHFGNAYAGRYFALGLEKRFPRALFFNVFNSKLEDFRTFLDPQTVMQKYDHFYLFGNQVNGRGLPYFDHERLSDIDSEWGFFLQEWTRK